MIKIISALSVLLMLGVAGCQTRAPESFMRHNPNWFVIPLTEKLSQEMAWQRIVDMLSKSYDLEVLNKDSGYVRTAWKDVVSVTKKGLVKASYRKRVTAKISIDQHTLEMKCEAQWWTNGYYETGYDEVDQNTLKGDVAAILGTVSK
jgi:hypothetical protein